MAGTRTSARLPGVQILAADIPDSPWTLGVQLTPADSGVNDPGTDLPPEHWNNSLGAVYQVVQRQGARSSCTEMGYRTMSCHLSGRGTRGRDKVRRPGMPCIRGFQEHQAGPRVTENKHCKELSCSPCARPSAVASCVALHIEPRALGASQCYVVPSSCLPRSPAAPLIHPPRHQREPGATQPKPRSLSHGVQCEQDHQNVGTA